MAIPDEYYDEIVPDREIAQIDSMLEFQLFQKADFKGKLDPDVADIADAMQRTKASMIRGPNWHGCLEVVPGISSKILSDLNLFKGEVLGGPGSEAWVMTCRANCRRFAPSAMPTPGIGHVFVAMTHVCYFQAFSLCDYFETGMTLKCMGQFLEQTSGGEFMNDSMWHIRLDVGAASFC